MLASGSGDHTIRVWDVKSGHLLWVLEGHDEAISETSGTEENSRLFPGTLKSFATWEISTDDMQSPSHSK